MKVSTALWSPGRGWESAGSLPEDPQLVLYFGSRTLLEGGAKPVAEWVGRYPDAVVCGCSTAGEIRGSQVHEGTLVAAVVRFDATVVRAVAEPVGPDDDSRAVGRRAAEKLGTADLAHVLLISDGLAVNGSALVEGIREVVGRDVVVTGGLAGDGDRFETTLVGLGGEIHPGQVVLVGFHGDKLSVGYGSRGGWQPFGPRRRITRSRGNTLFELDGKPALQLYKRYLGELATNLPASGLLFPLGVSPDATDAGTLVRTILAVDEDAQSLTFAGEMPEGAFARLMKATAEELVDGAAAAGEDASGMAADSSSLAILVSCVGRRLVLGQRTDEELEAVAGRLPAGTGMIGFYSYGEACPSLGSGISELHNQTMTITLLGESP